MRRKAIVLGLLFGVSPTLAAAAQSESGSAESGSAEPSSGEPSSGEPSSGEPSSGEPSSDEPSSGEPSSDEASSDEARFLETESPATEAQVAEPSVVEEEPPTTNDAGQESLLPSSESACAPADPAKVLLPWSEPSGELLAIGYEAGSWGGVFGQGLRLKMAFGRRGIGQHWGVLLRGLMLNEELYDATTGEKTGAIHYGGRLEMFGQSPALLNVIRVYGGGGVQLFSDAEHLPNEGLGWGGQFGFEFFYWRASSFFIEVGGQTGVAEQRDSHTLVLAGLHVYPFSL